MRDMKNAYKILAGKNEGMRQLGGPRRRWEDNIRIDLRKVGSEVVDWTHMAKDRDQGRAVVNTAMNIWVP
jgi:hypothetical protein